MALSTSYESGEKAAAINYIEALAELDKNNPNKKLSGRKVNKARSTKQK